MHSAVATSCPAGQEPLQVSAADDRPRRRRSSPVRIALVVVGIAFIVVLAWPAYARLRYVYEMAQGRKALAASQFQEAAEHFLAAARLMPTLAEPRYRLAVVYRRSGQLDRIEAQLAAAERRGWDRSDIQRQRLLVHAQVGRFHAVEKQLLRMFDEGPSDEAAMEIYEALAHGYWANHQVQDAIKCLNFWIQWQPQAVEPRLMLAEAYNEFNDPVSAERELREILKFAPHEAAALEALGILLVKAGKVGEAETCFRNCLQLGRNGVTVKFGLAECAYRDGRVDEAAAWLEHLSLEGVPPETQAKVLKLMADIEQFRRHHDRAVQLLEKALSVWPHDSAVHLALGQSYAAAGKAELAEKHFQLSREITARAEKFYNLQRQVITNPNDPELRYLVGDVLAVQGLLDDAAGWWRSALRCDPLHQPSLEAMARYYEQNGQLQLAAQFKKSAERAVPRTFERAWTLLHQNAPHLAAQLLELIRPYPQFQQHVVLLEAGLHNKAGRYQEALQMLDELPGDPNLRAATLILQGEACVGLGQLLEGEKKFLEALRFVPNAVEAHRWLAAVYYDLGAVNHAEMHLKTVATLDPNDPRPMRLLGLMNKDYEIFDQAVAAYKEALRRNLAPKEREEVLLELAECFIKQRDYSEALRVLEQAILSPQREVLRAECYYNLGQNPQAIAILDQVLTEKPDFAQALLVRGDAYLVEGQTDKAVAALARAAELNPFDYETRHRYAHALLRSGDQTAGQTQLAQAEELKQLREQFSKLHEKAFEDIYDPNVRLQLADLARKLGREDLAEVWRKAAEALSHPATSSPRSESQTPAPMQ